MKKVISVSGTAPACPSFACARRIPQLHTQAKPATASLAGENIDFIILQVKSFYNSIHSNSTNRCCAPCAGSMAGFSHHHLLVLAAGFNLASGAMQQTWEESIFLKKMLSPSQLLLTKNILHSIINRFYNPLGLMLPADLAFPFGRWRIRAMGKYSPR
ncbi:hypothetical protein [Pontibacter liquoris]|uniref:hypothetical protein n=1 Tax=Pontibacter liquoris TaxID=2905677 RepID=UPI001FA6F5B0|nr:hypothetical protein [Pontibacter liquoris]